MIAALGFYLLCSLKNRLVSRFKRLRQPKYLISALAGLTYLSVLLQRRPSGVSVSGATPSVVSSEALGSVEAAVSCILLLAAALPWLLPTRHGGLTFTESEIQFLFPAPIERRTLVHFRLIKGQLGILFGVLISMLLFGNLAPHPVYLGFGLWIVYSFLGLYRIAVGLTKLSLKEHGAAAVRRQLWPLIALAWVLLAFGAWLAWFLPPLPATSDLGLSELFGWLLEALGSGPAYYLLLPFRTLVRPAFAAGAQDFGVRVAFALILPALVYVWVMRSDVRFEEAALAHSERQAHLRDATGERPWAGAPKRAETPFRLHPAGAQYTAFLWKNLILSGRFGPRRIAVFFLLAVLAAGVSAAQGRDSAVSMLIGTFSALGAAFLTLFGPVLLRDDLRTDLLHLDAIKSYPVPGWAVVLGEVLAPSLVLAFFECMLVFVAAFALPEMDGRRWGASLRASVAVAAALLLPAFSFAGVLIQNAAALLLPGWVQLGRERQRGIEAMGQRLISLIANLVLLIFAVAPASLAAAAAFYAGRGALGNAVIPLAAAAALLPLVLEGWFAVVWMGRMFDRLDAGNERLIGATE
jgi:hypothetical protein